MQATEFSKHQIAGVQDGREDLGMLLIQLSNNKELSLERRESDRQFGTEKRPRKGFDKTVTALSNDTWTFVFNKTSMPGWAAQKVATPLPILGSIGSSWVELGQKAGRGWRQIGTSGNRLIADITRDRKSRTIYHEVQEGAQRSGNRAGKPYRGINADGR